MSEETTQQPAAAPRPRKARTGSSQTPAQDSSEYARGRAFGALELRMDRNEQAVREIDAKLDARLTAQAHDFNAKLDAQTTTLTGALEQRLAPIAHYIGAQQLEEEHKRLAAEARDRVMSDIKTATDTQLVAQQQQLANQEQLLDRRQRWVVPVMGTLLGVLVSVIVFVLNQLGGALLHGKGLVVLCGLCVLVLLAVGAIVVYAFRPRRQRGG